MKLELILFIASLLAFGALIIYSIVKAKTDPLADDALETEPPAEFSPEITG